MRLIQPRFFSSTAASSLLFLFLFGSLSVQLFAQDNSLLFDGTDDHITFSTGPSFSGSGTMTFEAWIYPTSVTGFHALASWKDGIDQAVNFSINNGFLDLFQDDGIQTGGVTGTVAITPNVWTHVAFVQTAGSIEFYVNGSGESLGFGTASAGTCSIFALGISASGASPFAGFMDELRVWNFAMGQAQLAGQRYYQFGGNESNLSAYYQFNEITGTVLPDLTANSFDGTLINFPIPSTPNWQNSVALAPGYMVVNTADTGEGSLRWCVGNANGSFGANTISFDPAIDGGVINLGSSLTLTSGNGDATSINGDSDGDFIPNITIQRSGTNYSGLIINGANCSIEFLHIQGFSGPIRGAIVIDGSAATGNTIAGNFIGTDITGNADGVTNYAGILLDNGASNNFIGDGMLLRQNVIGNNSFGIYIRNASNANTISGNHIGIGINGDADIGNVGRGIVILNSDGTTIGIDGEEINIISNNNQEGIRLDGATNTRIVNNYIGLDGTGFLDRGNGGAGISLINGSNGTQIGDDFESTENVISGNTGHGIDIQNSNNTVVIGNKIGLGRFGLIPLGNNFGINIGGTSTNSQVGNELARNIISANNVGIQVSAPSTTVQSNFIGTDETGTIDRGNLNAGINLTAGSGIIGGTSTGQGNVISGNSYGIGVSFGGFNIVGNVIGADVSGTAPIPNDNQGIRLSVGSGTNIGDGSSLGANLITFNTLDGILIQNASTTANVLDLNYIVENGRNGILIESDANGNLVSQNIIAGNINNGVEIGEPFSTGIQNNTLSQNAIYTNAGSGILITNGAQNGILPPTISSTLNGLIEGTAEPNATIEIFADADSEGEQYLDFTTADGSGNFSHQIMVASINSGLTNISVTQTSSTNTSEFASAAILLPNPFITTWSTTDTQITIPTTGTGYNYDITWTNLTVAFQGDGSDTGVGDAPYLISGLTPGHIYQIEITGAFPRIFFNTGAEVNKILTVEQWGDIAWSSMVSAFYGCSNLTVPAVDEPDLSLVTEMNGMFRDATSLVGLTLNDWNVGSVTNTTNMFANAINFNGNIGSWDTKNIVNFTSMFYNSFSFNQPLAWDMSSAIDLIYMFNNATAFNQDISGWDISNAIYLYNMFEGATSFNQPLPWNTSSVEDISYMFYGATSFNQDLSSWNTSSISQMYGTFENAISFNQDLSSWDIGAVTNMSTMLDNTAMSTSNYDATLIGWESLDGGETQIPSGVTLGATGLTYCTAATARTLLQGTYGWTINGDALNCPSAPFITTWVTSDTQITIPTTGGGYNYDIVWTNLTNAGVGDGSATGITGNYAITGLENTSTYQVEITGLFPRIYFNNGTQKTKIITVEQWGDIAWSSMARAFYGCSNLSIPAVDIPNLSAVTDMSYMLSGASSFNSDMSSWDVSNVQNMSLMFYEATSFNQPLNAWNVGNVQDMGEMFSYATAFNQPLNLWDVSNVQFMNYMFSSASLFNQPLNSWIVSTVTDMSGMFSFAPLFNQPLDNWDVSSVTVMDWMFAGSTGFNQSLAAWNIQSVTDMGSMLNNSALSIANYDATLIGWADNNSGTETIPTGLTLGANGLKYCFSQSARTSLGWTFIGDSQDCSQAFIVTNTNDSGTGSLRWCIDNANASTGETISFNIPGAGPWVITTNTLLPNLSQPVTMDGTTQPGWDFASENMVTIDLTNIAGSPAALNCTDSNINIIGLRILNAHWGVTINGEAFDDITIRQNIINQVTGTAINIQNADNISIQGNHIGVSGDGLSNGSIIGAIAASGSDNLLVGGDRSAVPNEGNMIAGNLFNNHLMIISNSTTATLYGNVIGASLDGNDITTSRGLLFNSVDDITIGDSDPNFRNYFAGINDVAALSISNADGLDIINNYFGVGILDTHAIGNSVEGMVLSTVVNFSIDGNVLSGSSQEGILLIGNTNTGSITNNLIGLAPDGTTAFGNATYGIHISTASQTVTGLIIGGSGNENTIAYNDVGIRTALTSFGSVNILRNKISCNTTSGIDISGTPVVTAPIISSISVNNISGISGEADGSIIRVYETNPSCTDSQGFEYVAQTTVNSGTWNVGGIFDNTKSFVATVSDATNGSSEFSVAEASQAFITTWNTSNPGTSTSSQILLPTLSSETYNYNVYWEEVGNTTNNATINGIVSSAPYTLNFGAPGIYRVYITGTFPRMYFNGGGDRQKILTVQQWGDIAWTSMSRAFRGCENLTIPAVDSPDLFAVIDLSQMLRGAISFNQNINGWNVSNVENMSFMFADATAFDQQLSAWDVGKVKNFSGMFARASSFNQDIGGWNVADANNMQSMFSDATSFNQNLNLWIVNGVLDFSGMFSNATSFNGDITTWNVGLATDMSFMFSFATTFNQDIGSWNVNNVTRTSSMFENATLFNQDIGGWTFTVLNDLEAMFLDATAFDQDISGWNLSGVNSLLSLFEGATSFNQDLGIWDVSNVTDMESAFLNATSFNQSLGNWDLSSVSFLGDMLSGSGLSTFNYDATIIGWEYLDVGAGETVIPTGITLGAMGLTYCVSVTARTALGWTFNGDSQDCSEAFVVTNTNDSGEGSLRWTIENANLLAGLNNITFNIPISDGNYLNTAGNERWTISPITQYSNITEQVTIDATTQPGSGNYRIKLDGLGTINNGFYIRSTPVTVYGFYITGFVQAGIQAFVSGVGGMYIGDINSGNVINDCGFGIRSDNAHNHVIKGNLIGTDETGMIVIANGTGIAMGSGASNVIIGGSLAGEGNLISGNTTSGISTNSASNWHIEGNLMGTNINGTGSLPNDIGISLNTGSGHFLLNNVISGNTSTGVRFLNSGNNTLHGNNIGVGLDGISPLGNGIGIYGISVNNADNNIIGGIGVGEGNIIANNFNQGILFENSNHEGNQLIGNSIYCNAVGIDLNGVANNNIQPPTINEVTTTTVGGTGIDGDQIHVYRDNSGCTPLAGQGQEYLGTATVSGGVWQVTGLTISVVNDLISATATDATNGTSEFTGQDPFIVTNTLDSGIGSLRWCMENANSSTGETITFNIGGAAPWVITIGSNLPQIIVPMTIDASTQPGSSSTSLVELVDAGPATRGFDAFIVSNVEIKGFEVRGFLVNSDIAIFGNSANGMRIISNVVHDNYFGIRVNGSAAIIQGNKVGTTALGTTASSNNQGIYLTGSNHTVGGSAVSDRNIVSGNAVYGINVANGSGTTIQGNYVGLNISGDALIPNGNSGISLNGSNHLIGGAGAGEENVIAGNSGGNVSIINATGVQISGNKIGTDKDGNDIGGATLFGVEIAGGSGNTIGGIVVGEGNTIAHHANAGIWMSPVFAATISNTILGNEVYCNGTGIDLRTGANNDIQPPVITEISTTSVIGTGIDGEDIHVYRDNSSCGGQGQEYLGTTTVAGGVWTVGGLTVTIGLDEFTATATNGTDGTSEFSASVVGMSEIVVFDGSDNTGTELFDAQVAVVDIGSAVLSNDITHTFAIENLGNSLMTISSITASDLSFAISGAPLSVGVGATETFDVILDGSVAGTFNADITINNDDADEGAFTFPITGAITSSEIEVYVGSDNTGTLLVDGQVGAVDFGSAIISNDITQTFAIENTGTTVLTISSILSSDGAFAISGTPASVNAGAMVTFDIILNGTTSGTFNSTITISSDDADESAFDFPVTGQITEPEIGVFDGVDNTGVVITDGQVGAIDFGTIAVSNDLTRTFAIENTGTSTLNIVSVVSSNTAYAIVGVPSAIGVGATANFDIVLDGSSAGTFSSTVTINSDDQDENPFTFPITGQITGPEIDVFFGADNTGIPIFDGQLAFVDLGTTDQGTDRIYTFTIENTGTSDLTIASINSSNVTFILGNLPTIIGSASSQNFTVSVDASANGLFTSDIVITSDDSDESTFEFTVALDVIAEQLVLRDGNTIITSGATIDLGTTPQDEPIQRAFSIENQNLTQGLMITNIVVNAPFIIVQSPTSIATGATEDLIIELSAADQGLFSETITITSNFATFIFDLTAEVEARNKSILVYNVVTPNGDGKHDFLKIERITEHPDNRVTIVDRWGRVVYQANNYDNNEVKFEGYDTKGNGQLLPNGIYFYVIETGKEKTTGYLQISTEY